MVNAHSHLELSYLRGAIASGEGFAGFAQAIGRVRNNFVEGERERSALFWDSKMFAEGVGAVGDISNGTSTVGVKSSSKIYYHTFAELFGLSTQDLGPISGAVAGFKAANLPVSTTPHSVYSLNKKAFNLAVNANAQSTLSIHFMESDAESELFSQRGHLWQWYSRSQMNVDFLDELSPVGRIINNIPSSRKVLLVHCSKITDIDITRLVDHFGDNLSCVVCPRSNKYIEGSTVDIEVLRRSGCRIVVGTDSLASTDNLSMIDQIKEFEGVPLEERLGWITINGAQALGLENRLGVIAKGARSGLVLVSGVDFESMTLRKDAFAQRII